MALLCPERTDINFKAWSHIFLHAKFIFASYVLLIWLQQIGNCVGRNMDQSETSQINYTSPSGEDSLHPLPPEFMVVSSTSWILIVTSAIVFVLGSIGNVYAVVCLRRFLRYTYSSMHHFLLHMCCTELLVISFTIPLDIIWRLSIGWYAGNLTCKDF